MSSDWAIEKVVKEDDGDVSLSDVVASWYGSVFYVMGVGEARIVIADDALEALELAVDDGLDVQLKSDSHTVKVELLHKKSFATMSLSRYGGKPVYQVLAKIAKISQSLGD